MMMMLPRFRRASPGRFTLERVAWLLLTFSTRLAVASASRPHSYQNPILPPHIPQGQGHGEHEFTLRHIYQRGTYEDPDLHLRLDVTPETRLQVLSEDTGLPEPIENYPETLAANSRPMIIHRLADRRPSVIESYRAHARSSGAAITLAGDAWVMDETAGPDFSSKETVLTFAKMTANDYIQEPGTSDWNQISGRFNWSASFGWLGDGLRGHIYADRTNSTIIVSLKGTSPALFDGAETTTNDKLNDNLYFSCCCGQGGSYLWRQVCDCSTSVYTANETCITEALHDKDRYYESAIDLYTNVTHLYPNANVWLTGHSLGGAMSSLLGLTFGLPTFAFQAIPDALAAVRLGLPTPPTMLPQSRQNTGIYHFGHTADPIYMGACNGVSSTCTWWGYAFESACHVGEMCVYDTVGDKGWRVSIAAHRIKTVISDVLEAYDEVAPCAPEEECYDCQLWKFFKSNGSETSPSSTIATSTSTLATTRTATCETPGWWGCLDKTTTASTPFTSVPTTTTTSSSTCKTLGWFGCKDPTTSTITTTVT